MKRIMILASDPVISKDVAERLAETYDVKAFGDCSDIFNRIAEYKPDLLIMDFYLSDTNSAAVSHQIKCNPQTKDIPLISISENSEMAKQCIKSGCDSFINKPVDTDLLISSIKQCLGTHKPEPQL